jgi:ketosteroid isomerase-like protein
VLPSNVPEFEAATGPGGRRPGRDKSRRGAIVAILALVVVLGVVLGAAAYRLATQSGSAPRAAAPAAGAAATSGAAAADPQVVAAIQQVIQRANAEQQQAIADGDPSVMSDTATADYYQEMAQINDDLEAAGVTAIKLDAIEWGPITVNGTTATATSYESWTTTYADGTSEQASRERNVYTLVQENGAWKIAANEHPDSPN